MPHYPNRHSGKKDEIKMSRDEHTQSESGLFRDRNNRSITNSFSKIVVNDSKFKLQQPKSKPVFQHVLDDAEVDKAMKQPEYS